MRVAKVPPPPHLKPEAELDDQVRVVAKTWMRAIDSRYLRLTGQKCGSFMKLLEYMRRRNRKKLESSKYYKLLCGAAEWFVEKNVPPAAWIAFMIDVWVDHIDQSDDKTNPPPAMLVLGKKSREKWYGWFRGTQGRYRGGKLLFTDTHRELMRRHDFMRAELYRLPPNCEDRAVKKVVAKYFPDDEYDDLLDAANEEADALQAKLRELRDRGEWLWTDTAWGD